MVFSDKFTLNGIESSDEDIYLVTFDSELLSSTGIPFERSISSDGYSQLNPVFKESYDVPDDIVLNFIYAIDDIPQEWSEDKLIETKKWLITDDFVPFISEDNPDYIYYLICKKIESKMTPHGLGVLECTFTPMSHFAYKKSYNKITITSPTDIIITNPSTTEYKPIINIKNIGNTSTINKISEFEIKGLNKDEVVEVDNLMLTVLNSNDENKFANCNRGWVTLSPGENTLKLSGNCDIEIICEFPILL